MKKQNIYLSTAGILLALGLSSVAQDVARADLTTTPPTTLEQSSAVENKGAITLTTDHIEADFNTTINPLDYVQNVLDENGNEIDKSNVRIFRISGLTSYELKNSQNIEYSYIDSLGVMHEAFLNVVVNTKPSPAAINLKTKILEVPLNSEFDLVMDPINQIESIVDAYGVSHTFDTYNSHDSFGWGGSVNTARAGLYNIDYKFTDEFGNMIYQQLGVLVGGNNAGVSLTSNQAQLTYGETFDPTSYIQSVLDVDGTTPIDTNRVKVSGEVNTSVAGDYPLSYHYTDRVGVEHEQDLTVNVASKSQMSLKAPSISLNRNAAFNPRNYLAQVLNADGTTPVDSNKVEIQSNVDESTPGIYQVSYRFLDDAGVERTADLAVEVKGQETITTPSVPSENNDQKSTEVNKPTQPNKSTDKKKTSSDKKESLNESNTSEDKSEHVNQPVSNELGVLMQRDKNADKRLEFNRKIASKEQETDELYLEERQAKK